MKNVLLARHAEVLSRIAQPRSLLVFDFDGTLAPIVRGPQQAAMRSATRELFHQACALFPTAVISGRARADVAARLEGAGVQYVVGNHGLEGEGESNSARSVLNEARERLQALVSSSREFELEDKGYSLTMHYRRARQPLAARRAILGVLSKLASLRAIGGKCVVNVLPEGGRDKGDALLALYEKTHSEAALYVGDDVTDEDVFALPRGKPGQTLVSIRVGRSSSSAADYYLQRQRDIDALLRRLIDLRKFKR